MPFAPKPASPHPGARPSAPVDAAPRAGRRSRPRHVAAAAWSLLLAAGTASAASLAPLPDAVTAADEPLPVPVACATAAEAYVWGWPLAYMQRVRVALERVPWPGRSGGMPVAPLNRLAMLPDRATHRLRGVACPNQDVLYGFGMFDLDVSPVVLQVPEFGDRFWLYQLCDHRTDSFADFGSLHGTMAGCHLVVGPSWKGTPPPGIVRVVRSPTRYAACLPRVYVSEAAGDTEAALPVVNMVVAYPLEEYDGRMRSVDWSRTRWMPDLTGKCRRGIDVTPDGFLDMLPDLLRDVPPRRGEEALYGRLARLVHALAFDPAIRGPVAAAVRQADRDIVCPLFQFRNVGTPLRTGWTTLLNGGDFGTDYLSRTAVAKASVFVNRRSETAYYFLEVDADGAPLDGRRSYRLTFPAGGLPPARGFWSLTVYDERHSLPDDAAGARSLGSRSPGLLPDADGSLSITLGPDSANGLTPPFGRYSLALRLYWPDAAAVDGAWCPPALAVIGPGPSERVFAAPHASADVADADPVQDVEGSVPYVSFADRVPSPRTASDRGPLHRSPTGHHGGGSDLPGAAPGQQGGRDARVR